MKSAWVRGAPEHFSLIIIYNLLFLSTIDSEFHIRIMSEISPTDSLLNVECITPDNFLEQDFTSILFAG